MDVYANPLGTVLDFLRYALDAQGLELAGDDFQVLEPQNASSKGPFHLTLEFRRGLTTQGLGIHKFERQGAQKDSWVLVPEQERDILSSRIVAKNVTPGYFDVLRPRSEKEGHAYSRLHPSPKEKEIAESAQEWLAPYHDALAQAMHRQGFKGVSDEEQSNLALLARDARFRVIGLFNRYGELKWAVDSSLLGLNCDHLAKTHGPSELAFQMAWPTGRIAAMTVRRNAYCVGFRLKVMNEVVGMLWVEIETNESGGV